MVYRGLQGCVKVFMRLVSGLLKDSTRRVYNVLQYIRSGRGFEARTTVVTCRTRLGNNAVYC